MSSQNYLNRKRKSPINDLNTKEIKYEINTVQELHDLAKNRFKKKVYNDYEKLEKDVINIYDIDETINFEYLKLLNAHYKKNKDEIDSDTMGLSDEIANNFYTYIFTLDFKDRMEIYKISPFFGENEIFEKEERYFFKAPMKNVFRQMINEILQLEDEEKPQEKYNEIIDNYGIPKQKKKNLIPAIFGNEEYRYTNYITHIGSILNLIPDSEKNENINEYIQQIIIAICTFKDYLLLDENEYQEENIRYIIFCIESIFSYSKNLNILKKNINSNLYKYAKFLFETIDIKREKLKKISKYIKNKDFKLDEIDNDTEIIIEYNQKKYKFKVSDHYFSFCNSKYNIIDTIINKENLSFSYFQIHNGILDDKLMEKKYNDYFKKILNSEINKSYIRNLEGINKYKYIFKEEKFVNEVKINYIIFPLEELSGLTSKDFYTVYLNNNLDKSDIEKILPQLGGKLIVKLHEIVNHIYRLIIHINDINIPLDTPTKIFIKDKWNDKTTHLKDGGDKYEAIIFGKKIKKFYLSGMYFIFDENNWNNKDILKFSRNFKAQNSLEKNVDSLKRKLNDLKKNNDFIRSFQKKYEKSGTKLDSEWVKKCQTSNPRVSFNYLDDQNINLGECGNKHFF